MSNPQQPKESISAISQNLSNDTKPCEINPFGIKKKTHAKNQYSDIDIKSSSFLNSDISTNLKFDKSG